MSTSKHILASLFLVLMACSNVGQAEDIDIFSGLSGPAGTPNLMFVVDSSSNSSGNFPACTYYDNTSPSLGATTLGNEQCALVNLVNTLKTKSDGTALLNLGIVTSDGIYMPLTPIDDKSYTAPSPSYTGTFQVPANLTNRQAFIAAVKAITKHTSSVDQGPQMQETWAYYSGGDGGSTGTGLISGNNFSGTNAKTGCQKNFALFLGGVDSNAHADIGNDYSIVNAPIQLNAAIDNAYTSGQITAAQQTLYKTTITTGAQPDKYAGNGVAREWSRFMLSYDINTNSTGVQSITTYSLSILGGTNVDMTNFIKDIGTYGGGKAYSASTYNDIYQSILKVLNEVQAVNSAFASSSLPVSVNAQGTFLNQVFIGVFRPDAAGNPRWLGNLKQYQFLLDPTTGGTILGDSLKHCTNSQGQSNTAYCPAISSSGTGFISANAISYWTCGGNPSLRTCSPVADPTGGFWINQPQSAGLTYDLPDGEIVEKGGAAQILRLANLTDNYATTAGSTTNPRNLYTYCPSGSSCVSTLSNTANVFDTSNTSITDTMLGTGSRTISSITSASTVTPTSTSAGMTGAANSVSITGWSKSNSLVTATVSSTDITKIAVGTQLIIATSVLKYNCNPCTVLSVNTSTNTFTYQGSSGNTSTPSTPYTANIYTNFVHVATTQPISVGQAVSFFNCLVFTNLNNTIGTVTNVDPSGLGFTVGTSVAVSGGPDTACQYAPNTATVVTASPHGFNTGDSISIQSASPTGYNGSWTITVTGTNSFTYQYSTAAPLGPFTGTGAAATSNSSTRTLLIRWVRGEDNYGDETASPGAPITVRPSIHGDVLHSRPVVLNYGGMIGVVAFYGSNDGVFHAVNANQSNPSGSTLPIPGSELWGFIPSEFYGKLNRLRTNSPPLLLPSTPSGITPTPQRKDYFADGSTGVYQEINASGVTTTANIYITMRRGGRIIYGLDVLDYGSTNGPTNPKVLWKITNNTSGFSELGQTWSRPKTAKVSGYPNTVLIFGAGYDAAEDSEPPGTDTSGRGIYIVDATTGALVWSATKGSTSACSGTTTQATCTVAGMNYSIPSDISLVDINGDGKIDRLYAVDTGGNVWRIDLEPTAGKTPDHWQVTNLAALGCNTGVCGTGSTPRKFFYPPDVVPASGYDAVLVGSGDREHPLYSNAAQNVINRIYALSDFNTGNDGSSLTTPITESQLFDATSASYTGTLSNGTAASGFYITLATGEKVVNAPATVAGVTFFGTNQPTAPSPNSCATPLGVARGYKISPFTGNGTFSAFAGGGLPPTPVYGLVQINKVDANGNPVLDNNGNQVKVSVPFCIGCGGTGSTAANQYGGNTGGCASNPSLPGCGNTTSGLPPQCGSVSSLEACKAIINASTDRHRTYWYIEKNEK